MRAIWKGSISFGLVNIPIGLFSATRSEELRFRLLRAKDLSPVNYKRVAQADGKEVPWPQIVKGYEYEKDRYVVIKDDDFKRADVEATQTVDIVDFVLRDEIDPMYFSKPYYMMPTKGGEKAYVLLRETLRDSNKVGIAKVVIKTREHLAAVEARKDTLVLELMHFSDELADSAEFKTPVKAEIGKKEREMAKKLVASMTEKWHPEKYHDQYRESLLKLIHKKVESDGKELPPLKKGSKRPSNVIDLVSVLQRSISESRHDTRKGKSGRNRSSKKDKAHRRSA